MASQCLELAEAVEEVGADRFCATIVPVGGDCRVHQGQGGRRAAYRSGVLLTRVPQWWAPKAWGLWLAKRIGFKKAKAAVARKHAT
jgi:hypothetical protein